MLDKIKKHLKLKNQNKGMASARKLVMLHNLLTYMENTRGEKKETKEMTEKDILVRITLKMARD